MAKKRLKQIYYRLERILKYGAQYVILLGERSNGKSFAVKEKCLEEAVNDGKLFMYLRRWRADISTAQIEGYFEDMSDTIKKITDNEYDRIIAYQSRIFLGFFNTNTGKVEKGTRIGDYAYLSGETHFKSIAYPYTHNIIFEEFITNQGYLPKETNLLMSFISTVLRRRKGTVYMIGNTISRQCPYFDEWQLTHIPKMEQGSIDIYNYHTDQIDEEGEPVIVKIAVEFCDNHSNNSSMFFGTSSKMITTGVWDTYSKPHLPKRLETYTMLYNLLYVYQMYAWRVCLLYDEKINHLFVYVYPYTKKIDEDYYANNRIVGDMLDNKIYPMWSQRIGKGFNRPERIITELFNIKHICYSDNLTGTEFEQMVKNNGGL